MHPTTLMVPILSSAAVVAWRIRETQRPVTAKRILLPPLGMATGFSMLLVPQTRVPLAWGLGAFLAGALLLSPLLIHTSSLTRSGSSVLLKRSPAFLVVLLALVAVRIAARTYVEQYVDTVQTGSLFFLLAFGMLLPWRAAMYVRYRSVQAAHQVDRGRAHAREAHEDVMAAGASVAAPEASREVSAREVALEGIGDVARQRRGAGGFILGDEGTRAGVGCLRHVVAEAGLK